jgi:hypothetical protein
MINRSRLIFLSAFTIFFLGVHAADARLPDHQKLTYRIRWLGLTVGTITTSINGTTTINGRSAVILEAVVRTTGIISKIRKIDSRFVSAMDTEKWCSLRLEVHRRDGSIREDSITEFDQVNHKAHYKNLTDGSEQVFTIPADIQDILSACYYFALAPFNAGDLLGYNIWKDKASYRLFCLIGPVTSIRLAVSRKKEKEAFLLHPFAESRGGKIFKGRVSAYYSCEIFRIPLFAVIKGPAFTEANISLVKIENET